MKRCSFTVCLLTLLCTLCFFTAQAEWTFETKELTGTDSCVSYPVFASDDMPEEAEKVNARIAEAAELEAYERLLPAIHGGTGLRLNTDWTLRGGVLSLCVTAEGKMPVGRPGCKVYPLTVDTETAEDIPFETLFTDAEAAAAWMEETLETEVEPDLSDYLDANMLFPVPFERYTLSGDGLVILHYDAEQLSFLSGRAGAVAFRYSDLAQWLDLSEDSPAMRILDENAAFGYTVPDAEHFWQGLEQGIAGRLTGTEVGQTLDTLGCGTDSESYPTGAAYEPEAAFMRGNLLLTDEDEETVKGILFGNADLYGIETGKTDLNAAMEMLGESATITMDEAAAESWRVCAGEMAQYVRDGWTVRLFADAKGIVQYVLAMK